MADGKLKILKMYGKMHQMTMHLMLNQPEYYTLDLQKSFENVTRLSDETVRVYNRSENGNNYNYVQESLPFIKTHYADLYGNLTKYREDYRSKASNPDPNYMRMLDNLIADTIEDMKVLDNINHRPGQSMMESVYAAQRQVENGPLQQEKQDLPSQDTLYGQNYPSQNTLYGQNNGVNPQDLNGTAYNYPGINTINMQQGNNINYGQNTGLYNQNLNGTAYNYPGLKTVNLQAQLHQGQLGQVVQPFRQQQFYGPESFYRDQMDLPTATQIQQQVIRPRPENIKYLQLWTIAPLGAAISDETFKSNRQLSDQMIGINRELLALWNTVYPFNPKRGEDICLPDPQDTQNMVEKYQQVINHIGQWKKNYKNTTASPSDQVLFMTDKMLEKLNDDMKVIALAGQNDITIPEAAYIFSKLPKHYGLEDDRSTPLKAPVRSQSPRQASAEQAGIQENAPKEEDAPGMDVNKASPELEKLEKALYDSDPKWMWSSSDEYSKMKKGVKNLNKWLREHKKYLGSNADKNSKEYKTAAKEYERRLNDTIVKVDSYLDKKKTEFEKDSNRKEDPGKQKWEQLRIRNALHSFDLLRAMQGNSKQTEASELRDLKVEGYKGSLLSESSARIFWGENAQNPAPQNPEPGLSL